MASLNSLGATTGDIPLEALPEGRRAATVRTKVATMLRLGISNLSRIAAYRAGLVLGLNPVRRLSGVAAAAPFFQETTALPIPHAAAATWQKSAKIFGCHLVDLDEGPPDWHRNPLTGQAVRDPSRPWWAIPDFDPAVGDIKAVWEFSRFDWVMAFAQRARGGDGTSLNRLNRWLNDWSAKNPPYVGPNWKCGQEASIRVMHLAAAALVLDTSDLPLAGLKDLVRCHLRRIAPTVQYAIAQDNNHGTSEAAALFIGGSWLQDQDAAAGSWCATGRAMLENRVARLVQRDGSFSQYSVNYHRLMLDTLSMAELWRRQNALRPFSARFYERARSATIWLYRITGEHEGDAPNMGANDGARLLQLGDTQYRDYRPTVQLAGALFADAHAYDAHGPWNASLHCFGVPYPTRAIGERTSASGDDGGFAVMKRGRAMAVLHYPRFKFRPSQSDILHLDVWLNDQNILRDGGTFSYNSDQKWLEYFAGVASHNTIQFDARDQMPRIGRFLWGDWPKGIITKPLTEEVSGVTFGAGYRDFAGATHQRLVELTEERLKVVDRVNGFQANAILRWRLAPGAWRLEGQTLTNGEHTVSVESSSPVVRIELTQGWESRHYFERTPVPVLEVEINQAATLTSTYRWTA